MERNEKPFCPAPDPATSGYPVLEHSGNLHPRVHRFVAVRIAHGRSETWTDSTKREMDAPGSMTSGVRAGEKLESKWSLGFLLLTRCQFVPAAQQNSVLWQAPGTMVLR